jgi:hypothetical protein
MNADSKRKYKNIDLPFICPLTGRTFNSVKGLAIYITKSLKLDHKYYYDNYINHRSIECYFCGGIGEFISVGKGYRNLCNNKLCIEKSFKSNSIDGIRYRENCSMEEANLIFRNTNKKNLEKRTKTISRIKKDNPNFYKENSRNCKEYWVKRGYSEKESIQKSIDVMNEIHKKTSTKRKEDKEKYKHSYNTCIEYYIKRGYSEEEGKRLISERQKTFSLEICINKYGSDKGLEIWTNRQSNWLNKLNTKPNSEKIKINRKKISNKTGYSKSSQVLFWKIYDLFRDNNIEFGELNSEFIKYDEINSRFYKYDYVDHTLKKVIEFNGDYWHCNPNEYSYDYFHQVLEKTAEQVWIDDKFKNKLLMNDGYDIFIIWESDFMSNPKQALDACIEFIKK